MVLCQCGKWKVRTKKGLSCPKCDVSETIIQKDEIIWERVIKNSTENLRFDESFPFEKNQFYTKKDVWQKLHVSN